MNTTQKRKAMLADLDRSGLTAADAKVLQLSLEDHKLKPSTSGYVIPYFDVDGNKTKFYRVRYLESTLTGFTMLSGKKPLRYNQPPSSVNEVYLPPYIDWAEYFATRQPFIITEGEKKAALATREGIPTIGLGGVWCFMSKRIEAPLLPVFDQINLVDRTVYICFDSDAATNPDILFAEETLAKRLTERGAVVLICRIPVRNGHKVGIDDYILDYNAAKFRRNILTSAIEYSTSKGLHALNKEVVYLREVGILYDYQHSMRVSATDFVKHTHSNRWVMVTSQDKDGNPKQVRTAAAKLWLEWEHRAELAGITYSPGQPRITEKSELNTWRGWGVEEAEQGSVKLWHKLLDALFVDTEPEARTWFERWCAFPIQNPGYKMATAVVMWGSNQGTGKTLCGHTLMKLYGSNATEVKDADLVDARFSWAEDKQFVLADDITGHNNRKMSNMFKTMVTQKTIHVNPKYIPSYTVRDCINYYFTSNDPDAFFLDDGDRRFFIHEVLADRLPDAVAAEYIEWADSAEGLSALFYHLATLPLGDFNPQAAALNTVAKKEMSNIGKSELGAWVARLKESPDSILNGKIRGDLFTAEELFVLYDPLDTKRATPNALAREMKRSGFHKLRRAGSASIHVGGRQLRLYAVRHAEKWKQADLKQAAEHYIESHSLPKEKF